MKLNPETQINPTDELIHGVLRRYDAGEMRRWQEISEGIGNVVVGVETVDNESLYLKFYNSQHPTDRVRAEVDYTQRMQAARVPVPTYRALKNGDYVDEVYSGHATHAITLALGIDGHHPLSYSRTIIDQLAAYHGRLHRASEQNDGVPHLSLAKDYSYYPNHEANNELVKIDRYVDSRYRKVSGVWPGLPSAQVHLDISRSNVLVEKERVMGIVDFEDVSNAPLAFCLAGTLWDLHETGATSDEVDAYIAAYSHERPIEPVEEAHLEDMVLLRGRIALHGSLLTGADNSKIASQSSILRAMIDGGN